MLIHTVMAQLLADINFFLIVFEICFSWDMPITPGQKAMAEKVTRPRIESGMIIATVSIRCQLTQNWEEGTSTG